MSETTLAAPPLTRDANADYLKAAAILAVVCIHADFPYAACLRFCVPVFITFWAYYLETGLARRPAGLRFFYVRDRFLRLLVVYFFWTIIYLAMLHEPRDWVETPLSTIINGWFGGYGFPPQYFFIVLFQWFVLFPFFRQLISRRSAVFWILGGVVFNVTACYILFADRTVSALSVRPFIYWLPYVALGIALARHYATSRPRLAIAAALFLALAIFEEIALMRFGRNFSPYLPACVTIGSLLLMHAIPLGQKSRDVFRRLTWIRTPLLYVGRNTMAIFVAHYIFLHLIAKFVLPRPAGFAVEIAYATGVVALSVVGSLLLAAILRRARLRILFGE